MELTENRQTANAALDHVTRPLILQLLMTVNMELAGAKLVDQDHCSVALQLTLKLLHSACQAILDKQLELMALQFPLLISVGETGEHTVGSIL
jgi:hypothetical protein